MWGIRVLTSCWLGSSSNPIRSSCSGKGEGRGEGRECGTSLIRTPFGTEESILISEMS